MTKTYDKLTADTITDDQIRALRAEADLAGDRAQVAECDQALEEVGDEYLSDGEPNMQPTVRALARESIAYVINDTRAQED